MEKHYVRALNGETFSIIENTDFQNTPLTVEVRYNPIYDNKGEIIGVGCFSSNITSRIL